MADTKKYLDLSGLTTLVNGIKDGTLISGRATADANGSAITTTYATKAEINALDFDQTLEKSGGKQQVVSGLEQENGKIVSLDAAILDGTDITYTKGAGETGPLSAATTVDEALKALAAKASAQELAAADKSVVIGTAGGKTTVKVNIKNGEKVINLDADNGIYTDIKLSAITPSSTTVKEEYALIASDGTTQLGSSIKIYKDSSLVSITYISDSADTHYQNLEYVYIDASGVSQTEYVDISALVLEAEFASGITVTNHIAHGVVDPASETDSQGTPAAFLTVGAAGFKLNGIKNEIERKINALDLTSDAAVAGQYVAAIEEENGIVGVKTRANVSEAVLNNYSKGTDGAAVAATDTLNQAISKLENQVINAKASATTVVTEGTDAGNNMSIAETAGADGHKIYTINLTDVASKNALDAEIAARKAVDGQDGQTYAANTSANYISDATSLNNADVKLDAAIKVNEDAITLLNADSATSGSVDQKVATAITNLDNKITGDSSDSVDSLTLNGLKNKIEAAAAAATTVVAKKDGEAHLSLSATTDNSTSATTYTIETVDVASDSATTTEFNNIEGAVGLKADGTYSALTGNYVSASTVTSIAKAIEALDTVIGPKNDTAANSGNTVYGKIQGTWERVRGTKQTGDSDQATPTLWSLKKDIEDLDAKAAAAHTKVEPKDTGHVTVTVVDSADTTGGTTYKKVTIAENDIASATLVGELPADASTTYSASTVVQYAKNYTDVQIDALDDSFVAITDDEITALFNNYPLDNSGSGE